MAIRSAARGLVIRGNEVLLERCGTETGNCTYMLPGGGQNLYEPLREAAERELLEESGYAVRAERLVCICETIYTDEKYRRTAPDYAHRVHHIFRCTLTDGIQNDPMGKDWDQDECVWMTLQEADALDNLYPALMRGRISELARSEKCEYLGCEFV